MIRRRFLTWVLAWVCVSGVGAETLQEFDVVPVWNGRYKAGKTTEVQVRLIAREGGDFAISTETSTAFVKMDADTQLTAWLPMSLDASGLSRVQSYRRLQPDATVVRSVPMIQIDSPHIAIVSEGIHPAEQRFIAQSLHFSDHDVLTSVSAQLLPRFAASYESVDMLVMHISAMRALQDRQIQAVSDYLMRCGRMVAVAFPALVLEQLKKVSGCHGKFLVSALSVDQISGQISPSLIEKPLPLPALTELPKQEDKFRIDQPSTLLVIFCAGYFVAGFIALFIARRQKTLLILPLTAATLAILVWGHRQPDKLLTSWLEMNVGDTSARYSADLTLIGAGIWQEQLELPLEAVYTPEAATDGQRLLNAEGGIVTPVKHALLSETSAYWQSALSLESPLGLAIENGLPAVSNRAEHPTQQGLLRWQGGIYPLPPLEPGQSWKFDPAMAKADHSELTELFAKQSKQDRAALLIPHTGAVLPLKTNQRGWLLLHADGSET